MNAKGSNDLCRVVSGFWEYAETIIRIYLAGIWVEREDVDVIVGDLMPRLSTIPAMIPYGATERYWNDYGSLVCDACTAEQKLFAAKRGYVPGSLLGDWPPTPIEFTEPFLRSIRVVVSELESEVNMASGGNRLH